MENIYRDRINCGGREITDDEWAAELKRLGMTAEEAVRPTSLELKVEYEFGRMSREEYLEQFIACGYAAKGYPVAPVRKSI